MSSKRDNGPTRRKRPATADILERRRKDRERKRLARAREKEEVERASARLQNQVNEAKRLRHQWLRLRHAIGGAIVSSGLLLAFLLISPSKIDATNAKASARLEAIVVSLAETEQRIAQLGQMKNDQLQQVALNAGPMPRKAIELGQQIDHFGNNMVRVAQDLGKEVAQLREQTKEFNSSRPEFLERLDAMENRLAELHDSTIKAPSEPVAPDPVSSPPALAQTDTQSYEKAPAEKKETCLRFVGTAGQTLQQVLTDWASECGWSVHWAIKGQPLVLRAGISFENIPFLEAVDRLLQGFVEAKPSPRAEYADNQVLILREAGDDRG